MGSISHHITPLVINSLGAGIHTHMHIDILAGNMNSLEKAQHRATKLVPTIANLPYEQRLKILNLQSFYAQ